MTVAELIAELNNQIAFNPAWADLPVHILSATEEDNFVDEVEVDCFDEAEGYVMSLCAGFPQ